jgi:hypothetical protein
MAGTVGVIPVLSNRYPVKTGDGCKTPVRAANRRYPAAGRPAPYRELHRAVSEMEDGWHRSIMRDMLLLHLLNIVPVQ